MAEKKSYIDLVLNVIVSVLCWTTFFLLASWHILLAMLGILNRERFLIRLQRSALIPLRMSRKVYLKTVNPCGERFEKQAIIICNHQSVLDILICLSLSSQLTVLMKGSYRKHPLFKRVAKYAGYHFVDEDPLLLYEELQKDIEAGYSVLVFPEGTRSLTGALGKFHRGAFTFARYFKLDLFPLVIQGAYDVLPKGKVISHPGTITLYIKPRFHPGEGIMSYSVRRQAREFEAYYREYLKELDTFEIKEE